MSQANEAESAKREHLAEIAALKAQLSGLTDPAPLQALLDHAAKLVQIGGDIDVALRQARSAVAAQLDAAAAAADREFVRDAVADSLRELGYQVADVDIDTPETLVLRQSTHGVRADIHDGKIDIRAVRLGRPTAPFDQHADRDAEDEFCAHLPGLRAALDRRGVSTGIAEAKLPGLFTPETVTVRKGRATSAATQDQVQPHSRKRSAR